MTIQRMVELLEIEHECILRAGHDDCDRNCADCDLVQDDLELHEMYTDVITLLKEQEAVVPKVIRTNSFGDPVHACGKCGILITESMNYCCECGKRIKWED